MSQYYNSKRGSDWNYGGKNWKLSRSKIDLFLECPRCFYIDNKLGIKRPPGFPFNLNSAVDALLKKEFDVHRKEQSRHPLMEKYGIEAVPFSHEEMDVWRENFQGVRYDDPATGMIISGSVDDIWVSPKSELIVVDYKATSKAEATTELTEDWHDGYKRQMEVYQWLLRKKGFSVAPTGYFVYCNGMRDKEAFDGRLEFEVHLIAHTGDDSWVEGTLQDIKMCLESNTIPASHDDCDFCAYTMSIMQLEDTREE